MVRTTNQHEGTKVVGRHTLVVPVSFYVLSVLVTF